MLQKKIDKYEKKRSVLHFFIYYLFKFISDEYFYDIRLANLQKKLIILSLYYHNAKTVAKF